jgi:hypothetical protein
LFLGATILIVNSVERQVLMTKNKPLNIGITAFGLLLIVGTLIWITLIEPRFEKLPTDLNESLKSTGTIELTASKLKIPVSIQETQRSTSTKGDVLIVEDKTESTPGILNSTITLGVDRSSRKLVSGYGDRERSGLWTYPIGTQQHTYSLWSDTAGRPTDAQFVGKEKLDGLKVYVFKTEEPNLPFDTSLINIGSLLGPGINAPFTQDMVIDDKIEPNTGIEVSFRNEKNIFGTNMAGEKTLVATLIYQYTDDTIADQIKDAKHHKTQLLWANQYGVWIGIGSGIVLILLGTIGILRARGKANA